MLDKYLRSHFFCSYHHSVPTEPVSIEYVKKTKVHNIVSRPMKTEELIKELDLSDLPHVKAQVDK